MTTKNIYNYVRKHWRKITLISFSLLTFLFGLYWLFFLGIIIFILRLVLLYLSMLVKNKTAHKIAKGFSYMILIFLISISAKLFVFGVFKIPSSSMENTLFSGDIILVNKLTYGPKLPKSPFEIPWINFLFYLDDNARENVEKDWWDYQRFSGLNNIKQGDILVFETSRNNFLVKRCVAVFGDKLRIKEGEVFVDENKYISPSTIRNKYLIKINKQANFYRQIDSLKIKTYFYTYYRKENILKGTLSEREYKLIKTITSVDYIKKEIDTLKKDNNLFLNNNSWTVDNTEEFKVPKKGMKIQLDSNTYNLYKKTIKEFENEDINEVNGRYFISNKEVNKYSFKKDYIFVLGDNRKKSKDSRYLGFIPVEDIVGKVQYVLYSNYDGVFQWNRLLKKVHEN